MKALAEHSRGFLLDWDGTLVDSLAVKVSNAGELFGSTFSADPIAVQEAYNRHSGVPRRELFDRIATDTIGRTLDDTEFDRVSADFTALNQDRIASRARLKDGTLETLEKLVGLDRLVFISTATAQDEIDSLAASFGVSNFCTEIMGSRPGFTKGPVHAAYVADKYGVESNHLMGVGDDSNDMGLFLAAGITAVGLVGTRTRADLQAAGAHHVIDDLRELVESSWMGTNGG